MRTRIRALSLLVALSTVGCGVSPAPSASPGESVAAPTETSANGATPSPLIPVLPTPAASDGALVAADLDGVMTSPELAHRLPLAVSIDDARAARPQSGFNAASVVWHAPADGYEMRYLLVFQEADTVDIGPVRSARNYLATWASELHAAFAHYGGDRLTRAWIEQYRGERFTDVDGIGAGNPAYHRIHTRTAPHNAYTSSEDLRRVALGMGASAAIAPDVLLRPFRDDLPAASRGTQQSFEVPFNTVTIAYRYEPAGNTYQRYINGKAQEDPADGERVKARTVVLLFMRFRTDSTIEAGHNRPVLGFIGSGDAWIYSEGLLVKGRWSKPTETDPTRILGPDGTELPLVRGRIFIEVVPLGTNVG